MEQPAEIVANAPYFAVATTESITRFADGTRITVTTSDRHYRDSKGRTRAEQASAGTDNIVSVLIIDSVTGQHYMLSPQSKSAQVTKLLGYHPTAPQQTPIPLPQKDTDPVLGAPIASLGEKDVDGVTAVGTRWEHTFAAGTVGNDKPITVAVEQWYSADLGIIVAASQHSSTGSDITYRLHNISRNEPDSALFAIPADYTQHEAQITAISATRKD
jgi:hypothetical protein